MQGNLFLILLILGLALTGTIVSLLYYIFVQKPEMKRELKVNKKKILDFLQNNPKTHSDIAKIAKSLGIEEFTVRDILLDLARDGNLPGIIVFPDLFFDFQYCQDVINSIAERKSTNEIPLKLLSKEFDTTKHNTQKILIELVTNRWINGYLDSTKEIFILQKEKLEKKELTCPFCNAELPSSANIPTCPKCGAEFQKCGVCNLIIGKENYKTCPFCGQSSHIDHLLEWLKIKGECPKCKHELHEFDLT